MSGAKEERRTHPRRHLPITGSNPVVVTVGLVPRAALVRDLSEEGIGLLAAFEPPIGSVLPAWLPGSPGDPSILVLLRVIHVQPPHEGLQHIGFVSHDESSRTGLRELLARLGD